jgi:hypothetical protein
MATKRRPQGNRKKRAGFPYFTVAMMVLAVAVLALLVQRLKAPPKEAPAEKPAVSKPSAPAQKQPATKERPKTQERKEKEEAILPPVQTEQPPQPKAGATASIVIDDVGFRLDLAQEASAKLPTNVTFAVIPNLSASKVSAELLHASGHHVILHAPMEPEDSGKWKPQSGELYVGLAEKEVDAILDRDLESVPFAEGINNHMGSKATKDRALMNDVVRALKRRGLYFLDSRTTPYTVAFQAARSAGLPCAQRAVFLDDVDSQGAIIEQVDALAERARKDGEAVAIGHLRSNTIRVLSERMPYWASRGIRFVPLKEVVR